MALMRDRFRRQIHAIFFVLVALVTAAVAFGTPHYRREYRCAMPPRFGENGCRVYSRCEYLGIQGGRVMRGEQCAEDVRLFPLVGGEMQ